ncbi:MAG TPA: methyltransferase domain-containing protein [Acidimicrobiales bacterium]|nr:methyltransferase domain-containing protein [Acidimicrobiales bacterium]
MSGPGRIDPFSRLDPSDDAEFYAVDRLVTHIEDGAIEVLRECYGRLLPPEGHVLDLMSSWRSHLPVGRPGGVTGLGMNANEMAANPQLSGFVVHDLNADAVLPFDDAAFDASVCTVSVQYLTSPLDVFADVRRVLRPGAPFAVAFSNRCFPTKAVAIWRYGSDAEHVDLVRAYFASSGFSEVEAQRLPSPDDPVSVVTGIA